MGALITKFLPFYVLFFSLITILPAKAMSEDMSIAEAINKAGRQRMLTQRIMKNYCLIGLDIEAEKASEQMQQAISLFELQMLELVKFSPTPEIKSAISSVDSQWTPFRESIMSTPSFEKISIVLEMSENLLRSSEYVVHMLEDYSGTPTSHLVNISGRQRMLSQRIAKNYLLQAWGFKRSSVDSELEAAKNEFEGALLTLINAHENTNTINEKLRESEIQWAWLSSSINIDSNEYYPVLVMDASEKMLNLMDNITYLYQQISPEN